MINREKEEIDRCNITIFFFVSFIFILEIENNCLYFYVVTNDFRMQM